MLESWFGAASTAPAKADTSDADEVADLKKMITGAPAAAPPSEPPPAPPAPPAPPPAKVSITAPEPTESRRGSSAGAPSAPTSASTPSAPKEGEKKKKGASPNKGKAASARASTKEGSTSGPSDGKAKAASPPRYTTSAAASSALANRPKWNDSPLRNPPGNLRGVRPMTNEPWNEVAEADNALRMNFGSREAVGDTEDEPTFELNGFVEEARRRRELNPRQQAWDNSPVKHMPPSLRGQKTVRRAEPWSRYHNDSIEELNAIDGVSINEIYAATADRDNRVKPTVVQPEWDGSVTLGRRAYKPGGIQAARAKSFRDARKPGTRAGSPVR